MNRYILVGVLIVGLIMAGCAGSQEIPRSSKTPPIIIPTNSEFSAPTATTVPTESPMPNHEAVDIEDIYGTWVFASHIFFQYNPDQTFAYAFSENDLASSPIDFGTFELNGSTFTFISAPGSPGCEPGRRGVYEIEFADLNRLDFYLVEDICHDNEHPAMTRISPIEKAIVGNWRFSDNPLYHMLIMDDGQICYGDFPETAVAHTNCNKYSLDGNLLTEVCGENNPECDAGAACLASVKVNYLDQLEYQVIPGKCEWGIHDNAIPTQSHKFYHLYP